MKKYKAFTFCLMILGFVLTACNEGKTKPVSNAEELLLEIEKAEDGAVIEVGDIDFTPAPGVFNSFSRVSLKKNITLKGTDAEKKAVFTNACFNLTGSKVAGETLSVCFEDICFDGGNDVSKLLQEDWEYLLDEEGEPCSDEPLKAQYAVSYAGNVQAAFSNCIFKGYMYENGPVMWAYYADYTGNPELMALFGDYSNCKLDITLTDCQIRGNAARYGGGALYLRGNNNIRLKAQGCLFSNNVSGCGEFSEGGGACCLKDLEAEFVNCSFYGNSGNHFYGEEIADIDRTRGGAISMSGGSLFLEETGFTENQASLGGALWIQNATTQISNCIFKENLAYPMAVNPEDESGPWSSMGLGGAVYINSMPDSPVRIYQTEFLENQALYGYGGIYAFYSENYKDLMPLGLGSVNLYECTLADNLCLTSYDYAMEDFFPWMSHPGDILEIEYLKMHGCVFKDEVYENDFPRYEKPTAENDYNYIASSEKAASDDFNPETVKIPENLRSGWYKEKKEVSVKKEESPFRRWVLPAAISILTFAALVSGLAAVLMAKKKPEEKEETEDQKVSLSSGKIVFSEADISALRDNVELRQILTDRELEVMCEYLSGSSRSALAEKLFITEATAKTHISNLYSKLEVRNKAELLKKVKEQYL